MNNIEPQVSEKDILRKAEVFDVPIILELLKENLSKNIPKDEKRNDVLHYEPTEGELEKIIKDTGIYLNLNEGKLKGYFMTMSKELAKSISFEAQMLEHAEEMFYKSSQIKYFNYVVLAQICVAKEFKGGSTFRQLSEATYSFLKKEGFELGVGEILDTNFLSLNAHQDLEDIGSYTDSSGMKWYIRVLDLKK